jgi:hypothetical protein
MPERRQGALPSAPHPPGGAIVPETGPERLGAPTVSRRKVIVTIGTDFGTSSTKVFFRSDEPRATSFVCLFEENPFGYPPIGLPSTVRVVNGQVFFAAEAERGAGGAVYRSFKTCLRCNLVNRHCAYCGDGPKRAAGQRILPDGMGMIPPEELAAWYLAHMISYLLILIPWASFRDKPNC